MLGQWHAYIAFGHGALTALRILVSHYARGCYSSSLVRREGHGIQCRGGLALDRLLAHHASGLHFDFLPDPAGRGRRAAYPGRVVEGSDGASCPRSG